MVVSAVETERSRSRSRSEESRHRRLRASVCASPARLNGEHANPSRAQSAEPNAQSHRATALVRGDSTAGSSPTSRPDA